MTEALLTVEQIYATDEGGQWRLLLLSGERLLMAQSVSSARSV